LRFQDDISRSRFKISNRNQSPVGICCRHHKKPPHPHPKKRGEKKEKKGGGKKRERSLLLNFLLGKFLNLKKKEKLMRFGD